MAAISKRRANRWVLSTGRRVPLTRRFLTDRRRSTSWWAFGLISYCAMMASFFPTIRDSTAFSAALDDYPDALKELLGGDAAFNLSTGAGFLHAELFSLKAPLLLSIVAVGIGASVAADEGRGLLDLLLANSIARSRYVFERALAMAITLGFLGLVMTIVLFAADPLVDFHVGLLRIASAVLGAVLLAMLVGSVALAIGSRTGQRSAAIGGSIGFMTVVYVANAAGELIERLSFLRLASPYRWLIARSPLLDDTSVLGMVFGAAVVVVMVVASAQLIEGRDLR